MLYVYTFNIYILLMNNTYESLISFFLMHAINVDFQYNLVILIKLKWLSLLKIKVLGYFND